MRVVETTVDRLETLLLVVLKPVDNDVMPVEVEVDNEVTLLFVVLKPVDNDVIPVEVEVDRLAMFEPKVLATVYSWLPLMASVLLAPIRPAATFWIRRSEPAAPTLTTPAEELAPANVP